MGKVRYGLAALILVLTPLHVKGTSILSDDTKLPENVIPTENVQVAESVSLEPLSGLFFYVC